MSFSYSEINEGIHMNYEEVADKIVDAINTRRARQGIKDDEPGKLVILSTNQQFDDWITADPDNSARVALGAKCPLFQHSVVDDLPNDPDATVLEFNGTTVGFVVDRLDDEAWQRKRF
jgi:hypothetical protein